MKYELHKNFSQPDVVITKKTYYNKVNPNKRQKLHRSIVRQLYVVFQLNIENTDFTQPLSPFDNLNFVNFRLIREINMAYNKAKAEKQWLKRKKKSKKPASTKNSKTNRGRFTSKQSLLEKLVCEECGSYFRRATWNIYGRKQIVWRCGNRLENGPKACGKSASPTEESLHRGTVEAIRSLVRDCRQEMKVTLQDTLTACITEEKENSSL